MSAFHAATRDSNTSMKVLTSSAAYFAIVFGAGFVFGMVRVMWLVPTVGVRVAELAELPLMLAVVVFRGTLGPSPLSSRARSIFTAHRRRHGTRAPPPGRTDPWGIVLGLTPKDVFLSRDPVSGTGYYLSLCAFALMPWFLGRFIHVARSDVRSGHRTTTPVVLDPTQTRTTKYA